MGLPVFVRFLGLFCIAEVKMRKKVNGTEMKNGTKLLIQFYEKVTAGLFTAILFVLAVFSAYSTSYLRADASEQTFFVKDNVFVNLGVFISVSFMILALRRFSFIGRYIDYINNEQTFFQKCRKFLLILSFGIAVFWVLSTQYYPGADQKEVQKAVLLLHRKDYSMFAENGYLAQYPNQLGLVWFSYLLSLIFGSCNYLVFQILNAAAITVIHKKLADICGHCGRTPMTQLVVIALEILFFPLTMYSSFIYGNVLGLACSLWAIEKELLFFEKKKKSSLVAASFLITLAIQLKANYLIFLIAMIIYAFLELLREKRVRFALIPLFLIFCHLGTNTVVKMISEQVSGYSLNQGTSSWSWIAMGLQDGTRASGWYNGYNAHSYEISGYKKAVHAELAKEAIRERMEEFAENRWETLEFFTKKTASQWNNPTFQAFWNVQIRSAAVTQSKWVRNMTSVFGTHQWTVFLNQFQFLILTGALLFCVFARKKWEYEQMGIRTWFLAMIFVGGFVFHLFWEAKCQYTISYFVLLIPYAVMGFEEFSETARSIWRKRQTHSVKNMLETILEKHFGVLVWAFLLSNGVLFLYGGGKVNYLTKDTFSYTRYLNEQKKVFELRDETYENKIVYCDSLLQ